MPIIYETENVTPLPGGLYSAARLIDVSDPTRLFDGVQLRTFNCGGTNGTWPTTFCIPVDPPEDPERETDRLFNGDVIWAADECGLKHPEISSAAALHNLEMNEARLVEESFATVLLADAGVAPALAAGEAPKFVRAVGEIEKALGNLPGVIHADLNFLAWAEFYQQIKPGDLTPHGHKWAFGEGYGALGTNLIGTGPVTVHRGKPFLIEGLDQLHNLRLMVAEREVSTAYECRIAIRDVA